jgi:hypothetical protein
MDLTETLIFYLCIGATIAVAIFLAERRQSGTQMAFLLLTALLFWPLYVPLLLSMRTTSTVPAHPALTPDADEMARTIAQVELELDAALSSLDGWAESALAAEADRLAELCHALRAQAGRIREMDKLLGQTEKVADNAEPAPALAAQLSSSSGRDALDRWHKSQHARINNLTRLGQVRNQTHADLMATLAWIRELVSMIYLAKFTGAPASRAEELVAQIAAAVEGVSAIAWQETELAVDSPQGSDVGLHRQTDVINARL